MRLPLLTGDALRVYLADHHAGATFGLELARRARSQNEGSEYGDFLDSLAREIEEDRAELEAIMRDLDAGRDPLKDSLALAAERLGRLKLNGRLWSYSPGSRVLELEGLIAGVSTKLALWRGLHELAADDARLDAARLDRLASRAQRQLRRLRDQHRRAARGLASG